MNTKVQVRDLRKGDILVSGIEIITGPVSALALPAGKVGISVRYANGKHKIATWNKATTVTVTNR